MNAVWIAGLAIFLSMAMFLTLALCRCAALADRGIESYLPELDRAGYGAVGHIENSVSLTEAQENDPSTDLSPAGINLQGP
ncbi:MAG: hypothetical protein ACWGO1_14350 [Anaerolineales bacterium]